METSLKHMTREQRGKLLFLNSNIEETPKGWCVPSQRGKGQYNVSFNGEEPKCNCPDRELRRKKCKHIFAVEFYLKQEIDNKGRLRQEARVRVTYSQDWKKYNKAQTNEKIMFMKLLKDLCDNIKQPDYKFGRPRVPLSNMIFTSALKVYSTFSGRRFMSDLKIAKEMQLIDKVSHYNSMFNYFNKQELTEILQRLIQFSALPLKSVETKFCADSSGFSTSRFARYFSYKHGKDMKYRIWLKAHLISGVKTNIVTWAEITEGECADSPQLPRLVEETAKNFEVGEVSCDKAYSSKKNLELIENVGAVGYIPFKKNVTGKQRGSEVWKKMWHYFMYKHDDFLEHYSLRSNAETVFHMIKTKFKDNLRSKSKTAQVNELLLKILCHNICCVIAEMSELGIEGEFSIEKNG